MKLAEIPTIQAFSKPFANDSTARSVFPANSSQNMAGLDYGWNAITSTPIDDGGKPPVRADFNGLGYVASYGIIADQWGLTFGFDASVAAAINGYPKGAVLWYKDANGIPLYMVTSCKDDNSDNFQTTPSYIDGTSWRVVCLPAYGGAEAMTYKNDKTAAQVRNIAIVNAEPATGNDGDIYGIVEN